MPRRRRTSSKERDCAPVRYSTAIRASGSLRTSPDNWPQINSASAAESGASKNFRRAPAPSVAWRVFPSRSELFFTTAAAASRIVCVEADQLRGRKIRREALQVSGTRAAPGVNGLVFIADHADVLARAGE